MIYNKEYIYWIDTLSFLTQVIVGNPDNENMMLSGKHIRTSSASRSECSLSKKHEAV